MEAKMLLAFEKVSGCDDKEGKKMKMFRQTIAGIYDDVMKARAEWEKTEKPQIRLEILSQHFRDVVISDSAKSHRRHPPHPPPFTRRHIFAFSFLIAS